VLSCGISLEFLSSLGVGVSSHGDCDSESDDLENQGPELSSTGEGDAQFH